MIPLLLALQLAVTTPTVTERVDQALVIGSISASSVALGLTISCTSTGECRELNPLMRQFLDGGPVRATVVKATVNGATTYYIWRVTHGRKRTVLLASYFAINMFDAVHNIRQTRKLVR